MFLSGGPTARPRPLAPRTFSVEEDAVRPSAHRLPSAYTLWSRLARLWDRLADPARPAELRMRPVLQGLEDRTVPSRPLPYPVLFAGAGAGGEPVVRAYAADTGAPMFTRTAYEPSFTGGVRVAA